MDEYWIVIYSFVGLCIFAIAMLIVIIINQGTVSLQQVSVPSMMDSLNLTFIRSFSSLSVIVISERKLFLGVSSINHSRL